MAEKRPHNFFKRFEADEHLPLDKQPIPAPDDRYKQFLRNIRNRDEFIRELAGVFGFNQTHSDYSKVLAFSDEKNRRAADWTELASSYKKPRNANEWLRLYAPIIFEYCAPRVICAMKDHAPPHPHYKTGIPVNKDLDHLRSFAMITNPERKNELNDRIAIAEKDKSVTQLADEISENWRDWIDPKFIGLYREPAQPEIPAVLKTPDKEPDSEGNVENVEPEADQE